MKVTPSELDQLIGRHSEIVCGYCRKSLKGLGAGHVAVCKTKGIWVKRRSKRTGKVVCICGKGYGSEFDGKCVNCRGGKTAWEARNGE